MTTQIKTDDLDEIMVNQFTNEFRKGYMMVNGFSMPVGYKDHAETIENFEVKDDDIWVCSFPKTGTTWTQEMIWNIVNNLNFEEAKVPLPERFPFLEFSALFDCNALKAAHPGKQFSPSVVNSVGFVKDKPSPRFIKCHLPFCLLPRQIRTGEKRPKIIYVARNPKDTCISYYHHCQLLEGYRGNFDDFCRLFLGNKLNYTPYWDHILDFWKQKAHLNMLFLKYEYMKADLPAVIEKSAAFLDKTLSDDQVKTLAEHLNFANMKTNPAVNYEQAISRGKMWRSFNTEGSFIRSGEIGQWKERMSDSLIQEFNRLTEEKFTDYNLIF